MLTTRRTIGLAATRQAITAVEVITSRGRHRLVRAAELPLTAEVGPHDPARLGKALKELLHANRFSGSRCVIGLEAAQLAAKEKRLPAALATPAAMNSLDDILRIAAEQDFASDGQDLIFDYAPPSGPKGAAALLVAAPRPVVDPLLAAVRAAGLSVAAVTSSDLALAEATAQPAPPGQRLMLFLSSGGANLVAHSESGPHLLRRLTAGLGTTAGAIPAERCLGELEAELRRVLAGLEPMAEAQPGHRQLLVWNGTGLDEEALRRIGERLALPTRICSVSSDLAGLDGLPSDAGAALAPAVALAVGYACPEPLAVDFLHSRLAVRPRRTLGRLALWGSAAAIVALAAGLWLLLDWRSSQQEISQFRSRVAGQADPVRQAKDLTEKAAFARGWYDRRPRFLDCMREVTLAFSTDGKAWATSLAVREDLHVVLSGKSVGEAAVLDLLDNLKSNPRLAEVKPLYIRQVTTGSREVSFAINFRFVGAD